MAEDGGARYHHGVPPAAASNESHPREDTALCGKAGTSATPSGDCLSEVGAACVPGHVGPPYEKELKAMIFTRELSSIPGSCTSNA